MQQQDRILLTGAAGFIGSYMLGYLNRQGFEHIFLVDDFSRQDKLPNYNGKKFVATIPRDHLFEWLANPENHVDYVFHLGARTDTTEFDYTIHERLNVQYSQRIWEYCTLRKIPLVYASSAATYGNGEYGYRDDHEVVSQLKPLNPYGVSKNEFDRWALSQSSTPPFWAGLKFFNVYGPNEYHKGRMASVVLHAFGQIRDTGKVKLFRSHRPDFKNGEQLRDFIHVEDVVKVCCWLMQQQPASGLYNVGTGVARSFNDQVKAIFHALELQPHIEYIDTPEDIREKYQYFTEADMHKLRDAGYTAPFKSLEEGVTGYVSDFLRTHAYY